VLFAEGVYGQRGEQGDPAVVCKGGPLRWGGKGLGNSPLFIDGENYFPTSPLTSPVRKHSRSHHHIQRQRQQQIKYTYTDPTPHRHTHTWAYVSHL